MSNLMNTVLALLAGMMIAIVISVIACVVIAFL